MPVDKAKEGIMSLIKKEHSPRLTNETPKFFQTFFNLDERSDHPYKMAVHTYYQLQETTGSPEEAYLFMLEDIIYSSLYATFYEQLLFTVKENPLVAEELITAFEADHEERERIIAGQTENHLSFILNEGKCSGCPACENHGDVAELVSSFHGGDFEFFKLLYLGMQTIQYAMEELSYDYAPEEPHWYPEFTPENILEYRQRIIEYVENKKAC
jgi:hypothetical protein